MIRRLLERVTVVGLALRKIDVGARSAVGRVIESRSISVLGDVVLARVFADVSESLALLKLDL